MQAAVDAGKFDPSSQAMAEQLSAAAEVSGLSVYIAWNCSNLTPFMLCSQMSSYKS